MERVHARPQPTYQVEIMHKSFFPLFLISLVGVLVSGFVVNHADTYQWLGLAAGIIPLFLYYFFLSRKDLLSSSEVDSVYYFGFLVTVITLVSTAISIGISPKMPEVKWILLQFGLGLIATGFSLFARLMLMNKSSNQVELNVVESSKVLVNSITEVSGQFDKASYQAKAFTDQLQVRFTELILATEEEFRLALRRSLDAHIETVQKNSEAALSVCRESIASATNNFSGSVSTITGELGRLNREAQSISFESVALNLNALSGSITDAITNITNKTNEASSSSAAAIAELASTTRKIQKLAVDIAAKLEKIEGVQALVNGLNEASQSLGQLNLTANNTNSSLSKLNTYSLEATKSIDSRIIEPLAKSEINFGIDQKDLDLPNRINALGSSLLSLNARVNDLSDVIAKNQAAITQRLSNVQDIGLSGDKAKGLSIAIEQLLGSVKGLVEGSEGLRLSMTAARLKLDKLDLNSMPIQRDSYN